MCWQMEAAQVVALPPLYYVVAARYATASPSASLVSSSSTSATGRFRFDFAIARHLQAECLERPAYTCTTTNDALRGLADSKKLTYIYRAPTWCTLDRFRVCKAYCCWSRFTFHARYCVVAAIAHHERKARLWNVRSDVVWFSIFLKTCLKRCTELRLCSAEMVNPVQLLQPSTPIKFDFICSFVVVKRCRCKWWKYI